MFGYGGKHGEACGCGYAGSEIPHGGADATALRRGADHEPVEAASAGETAQKVVAYKCVSLSDSEHDERSAAVKSAQGGQREGMGVEVGHAVLRECHQKAVKIMA